LTASTNPRAFRFRDLINLKILLVFLPLALLAHILHWGEVIEFTSAALAIVPLSIIIGEATEELASKLGQNIGGLLNATLGNAAELIITIVALQAGLTDLVKASIVGSIVGNLLLVTGMSFVIGGAKNGSQTFGRRVASMNATMLILAFLVLAIPSGFDAGILSGESALSHEVFFSVGIGLVMVILYGLSTFYVMRDPQSLRTQEAEIREEVPVPARVNIPLALLTLLLATIGILLMSEALVGTVEPLANSIHLSEFFVGIIIVPLIGNVAEHAVAVRFAYKNRMDLSLAISVGSSLQVALFVAPVLVFISLLFQQKLLLVFNPFELLALAAASIATALVSQDGESNWMEGVQLLAVYFILALAFFLLPSAAGIPVSP